jgi:hypothetical protein
MVEFTEDPASTELSLQLEESIALMQAEWADSRRQYRRPTGRSRCALSGAMVWSCRFGGVANPPRGTINIHGLLTLFR